MEVSSAAKARLYGGSSSYPHQCDVCYNRKNTFREKEPARSWWNSKKRKYGQGGTKEAFRPRGG